MPVLASTMLVRRLMRSFHTTLAVILIMNVWIRQLLVAHLIDHESRHFNTQDQMSSSNQPDIMGSAS